MFRSIADAPLILVIEEVAAIYRVPWKTVENLVYAGKFTPAPFAFRPMRWHREDLETDLANRRTDGKATARSRTRKRKHLTRRRRAEA